MTRLNVPEMTCAHCKAGVEAAMAVWVPIYLLLMQKRIYRQGWLVTLLKTIQTVLFKPGS